MEISSDAEAATLLIEGHQVAKSAWRRSIVAGASLVFLGTAALFWTNSPRLRRTYLPGLEAKYESQCGLVEPDTNYMVWDPYGYSMDHIPSPEMCCALCQGDARCLAWTWVEDAGLPGCPSQCWVKGGVPYNKSSAPGIVSGLPPKRKALPPAKSEEQPELVITEQAQAAVGTVFCFTLIMATGYEKGLVAWQKEHNLGIFGCDEFAVYSNSTFEVAPGVTTGAIESDMHCEYGGDSYTALNAWIFIALWKKVLSDGRFAAHDWTVKVDADSVFFPHRLAYVLQDNIGADYLNNCRFGLHGPIEVVSRKALMALEEDYNSSWDGKAPKQCVTQQNFGLYGEDMFIDICLGEILNQTANPIEPRLMCEAHCDCPSWYWCNNGTDRVVFHPFKTIDAWSNCYANSMDDAASR